MGASLNSAVMANRELNPSVIAREALKRLAEARQQPTPDNFAAAYHELGGGNRQANALDHVARVALERLLATHSLSLPLRDALTDALARSDWRKADEALKTLVSQLPSTTANWPALVDKLITQYDIAHVDFTRSRKREGINHVLAAFSADSHRAYEKLSNLVAAWARSANDTNASDSVEMMAAASPERVAPSRSSIANPDVSVPSPALRSTAVDALGTLSPLKDDRRLADAVTDVEQRIMGAATDEDLRALKSHFADIEAMVAARIARGTHNEASMRSLLGTLCQNMVTLAPDGSWVGGQVSRVAELLEDELDSARLAEAEETLRNAIVSQGALKQNLEEAKHALKTMLATFVDRLATVSDQAGQFHDRMDGYVQQIETADDIQSLSDLVNNLMGDTRDMQSSMRVTHDELVSARDRARDMESRVQQLEIELRRVSEQVRIDPLTEVLNRRGLARAFEVERARRARGDSVLAVAVIDIDDFKRLNDSLGHAAGDEALKHLSKVVRQALRPTDVVARFGGEEFVLLLPGSSLDEARNAVQRLQRQLTREFFLHDGKRVFIAFSAGVAMVTESDSEESVLQRADQALYIAKRAGKNRVVCEGESLESA